jgi:hypothetical protein
MIDVGLNYKFAVLALPDSRGGPAPQELLSLPAGFAVSRKLPDKALQTWYEDLGRFKQQELRDSSLFLWALRESASPDILDHENHELAADVYRLFLGLLFAVPYFSCGTPTVLTGANADGTTRVRSLGTYDRFHHIIGSPPADVSIGRLRLAARLAIALQDHDRFDGHERMERAFRAFREASETLYVDTRLHQFVRAAETLVAPHDGATFAVRVQRVCAGNARPGLKQIYSIRSGIEHLHGPYDRMPKRLSRRGRLWRLVMRTMQIEAVSRYMLTHYLLRPSLWPHLATLKGVKQFWSRGRADFLSEWPSRIAFTSLLRDFDYKAVEDAEADGRLAA